MNSTDIAISMNEVSQLRAQGRHLRSIGCSQLSHAAYRAARTFVRELRTGQLIVAPCMCNECAHGNV